MGNLILSRSRRAEHPYFVEELGIHLYTGEELSYFIYHNLMLIDDNFLDERLFRFIGQELGMNGLEMKLRKWVKQADQAELLMVILQDIHYYSSAELFAFKEELARIAKAGPAELMKEKADYLMGLRQYYGAIRLYDRIFTLKSDELMSEGFRGNVWFNKGSALAGIFSFDQAVDCYEKAYRLLNNDEALKRMFFIHLLDGLVRFPEELYSEIPSETIYKWKEEFEESRRHARYEGKALETAGLMEKDNIRRTAGFRRLIRTWKAEYRRNQGQ